jgi:hypothetical protein
VVCQNYDVKTTTTTQNLNQCKNYICQNGGSPKQSGNQCSCQCPDGFSGIFCQNCDKSNKKTLISKFKS